MLVKNGVKSSQTPAHFLNADYLIESPQGGTTAAPPFLEDLA